MLVGALLFVATALLGLAGVLAFRLMHPRQLPPSNQEQTETGSHVATDEVAGSQVTAEPVATSTSTAAPRLGEPSFEAPLDARILGAKPSDALAITGAHGRPLRILCLHGQNSNSDVTLLQLSNLGLGHRLWCDLLTGPWEADGVADVPSSDISDAELRSWWPWAKPGDEPERSHLARCVRYLLHYLDSARLPYDGLYGFSQGAAMATLASMPEVREQLGLSAPPRWKFTICAHGMYPGGAWYGVTGGESMSGLCKPTIDPSLASDAAFDGVPPELLAKVTRVVDLPSLHLMGANDHWRTNAIRLQQMYVEPAHFEHEGRHEIPAKLSRDPECQSRVNDFFKKVAPLCT